MSVLDAPVKQKSTKTKRKPLKNSIWNVIVLDDCVNTMSYVVLALKTIFGYDQTQCEKLMLEVHKSKRSVVWSGTREQAEFYLQELLKWKLTATLEERK